MWVRFWEINHDHSVLWRVRCPPLIVYSTTNAAISQLFWGEMVASRGLGPKPIPYKSLTTHKLADAIRFCLQPTAQSAARDVAKRMSHENGVSAAVASFHRNLPVNTMACDVLDSQAAVWQWGKGTKRPIYLSKVAAEILLDHHRLKLSDLQPYVL